MQRNGRAEPNDPAAERERAAERFSNFPRVAVEEAIANAVCHRSYEVREEGDVRISPEDLIVLSFPGPDRSVRMEDLRSGRP